MTFYSARVTKKKKRILQIFPENMLIFKFSPNKTLEICDFDGIVC